MFGKVKPEDIYIGRVLRAKDAYTYDEFAHHIPVSLCHPEKRNGGPLIINAETFKSDAILIKVDDKHYLLIEPKEKTSRLGANYKKTVLPVSPLIGEGYLFVEVQSLKPFISSDLQETSKKRIKIRGLVSNTSEKK